MTTGEDRAYAFTAGDFGFADDDAGDTLASVTIVTPPAAGTLALDGTAVMADDVVTKAQIDGDMLTFTPARDAHGDPYTTFTFTVNDGTDDSASAYTMTIDVTDAPVPVCGVPDIAGAGRRQIWTGTVTVGVFDAFGPVAGYGYETGGIGSLLPAATFPIGSTNHTILGIAVLTSGVTVFTFQDTPLITILTPTQRAALRLHVCDEDIDFSAADHVNTSFSWTTSLDWSPPVVTRTVYLSLPANNAATGEPAITGTAVAGQELTATAGTIMDIDGLTGVDFTYQWVRVNADGTSNEEAISGEIAATYTLTNDDVGKRIKVQVSFTDDLSGLEMRISAAYPSSGTVQASSTPVSAALVSNVGQTAGTGFGPLGSNDVAQSFRTGPNATGYTLTSIELRLNSALSTDTPTVKLYSGSANGTEVATFTGPSMLDASGARNYTFTPSSPVHLGMSTTYWVVAEGNTGNARWLLTPSTSEDATPAMGWGIGDAYEVRTASSTGSFVFDIAAAAQIRVNGTTVATAPSTTAPALLSVTVTSTPHKTTDTYGAREHIEFSMTFDAPVTVTGDPTFAFDLGGASTATWYAGSGTATLRFSHAVSGGSSGDRDTNGISWAANAIALNGGTIAGTDNAVAAILTHVAQSNLAGHKVDGRTTPVTPATVTDVVVTSTPASADTYGFGETIVITVTVSEAVEVEGDPVFRFSLTNSGGAANDVPATYDRTRSSATTMVFTYTVQAGDMDNNGIWIGDHSRTFMLDANDRIRTASQQIDIDRSHPEKGTHADHKVDGSLGAPTVPPDPTAPTLVSATATTLTIEWTHPGDGGSPLTRNFIEYRVEGTTDWTNWYRGETPTPVTRTVITNLEAATAYDVRVHSTNAIGNSQWTQSASAFSTLAGTAATGAPTITGTAQVGETLAVDLTGIEDADGLTSPTYTYQWIRVDGTEADIAAANLSTYTLVDADLGNTLKVRVSFDDDGGNTETLTSAATATVTPAAGAPGSPTILSATVGVGQVVLVWEYPLQARAGWYPLRIPLFGGGT